MRKHHLSIHNNFLKHKQVPANLSSRLLPATIASELFNGICALQYTQRKYNMKRDETTYKTDSFFFPKSLTWEK